MDASEQQNNQENICPKCGGTLSEVTTTSTGRKLQRCSNGSWDSNSRQTIGCDYVKWLAVEPQPLDEKCPKCGSQLVLAVTRFGKKMKKCSKGGWDKEARKPTGCDYIEWIDTSSTETLDEECPECGKPLVLFTTSKGKRMKKCSTSGWDREKRQPTGCGYVEWLKPGEYEKYQKQGEEFLPPEE